MLEILLVVVVVFCSRSWCDILVTLYKTLLLKKVSCAVHQNIARATGWGHFVELCHIVGYPNMYNLKCCTCLPLLEGWLILEVVAET